MKKWLIFSLIGIIVLLFLVFLFINSEKVDKKLTLCNESYSKDCPANSIIECRDIAGTKVYLVEFRCTDLPDRYFDYQFKYLAECGGMPLADGGSYESSSKCKEIIDCSDTNIVFCQ